MLWGFDRLFVQLLQVVVDVLLNGIQFTVRNHALQVFDSIDPDEQPEV